MKKLALALTVALFAVSALFAAPESRQVVISGRFGETALQPTLFYNDGVVADGLEILNGKNEKFDLSENGETGTFSIRVSGNEEEAHSLSVSVESSAFYRTVNNERQNTDIKPTSFSGQTKKISAGYHEADTISSFTLSWTPSSSPIDAGDYTSDVTITYSID